MNEEDILSQVRQSAVSIFRCKPEDIQSRTIAANIDGWDSMSHTVFLLDIEKRLKVSFDPYTAGDFNTIADLVAEVRRLRA